MAHRYFPHTDSELSAMLQACGMQTLDDLYGDIPEALRFKGEYELPESMSEIELRRYFERLSQFVLPLRHCYIGAGFYDHYSPAVVADIVNRSEFLTSYTPYQAEISQGTLQYIFEYQSMMAELTGMEVSNASMYDGATATAEAMMMAVAAGKKRNRVLLSDTVNPAVRRVVNTYAKYHGVTVERIAEEDGVTSRADFEAKVSQPDVAGVIVSMPNYYGIVEDYSGWADKCHDNKTLLIMNSVASALAVLKSPGEWGADIAVGDGQSLGLPLSFGGPSVGYLCTSKKLIRKMPGRIVGATTDADVQRAFVLTLQAREQHIRREKATSNICSNESLMALYVTAYMALMGHQGLREINERGSAGAHYVAEKLCASGQWSMRYPGQPFLNEFAVKCDHDIEAARERCMDYLIEPGLKLDEHTLLISVTETAGKDDLDLLIKLLTQQPKEEDKP